MSVQTKTRAQKAGKFLGVALFAFLMFFNIKFAIGDNSNGDIDLLGLKVSVFTNSTYATASCSYTCYNVGSCGYNCNYYAINGGECGYWTTRVSGFGGDYCDFF